MQIRRRITLDRNTAYYYDTWKGQRHPLPNYLSAQLAWKPSQKLPHSGFVNAAPFSSLLGADHMTFSWHGHVSNKMATMCSGKRRRYPPVCSVMMFRFVWEGLSAKILWIFASSASLRHHLVVESRVHHTQSRKHKRMWQTTEVSPKINNLGFERTCPTCVCYSWQIFSFPYIKALHIYLLYIKVIIICY